MAENKWQLGEVLWFNEYSGEGEVRGPDGNDFFVHYSAIDSKDRWKKLKANQEVKFKVNEDPRRQRISKIKDV